jgi:hypothetical protein
MIHQIDIYLMGPYSHKDYGIRQRRYNQLTQYAAKIAHSGLTVFSPITHSHPMTLHETLPGEWAYWKRQDEAILRICREAWQMEIKEWEQSVGCTAGREIAESLGIPVVYIDPERLVDDIKYYKKRNNVL